MSMSGAVLVFSSTLISGVAVRRRIGRLNVGLVICGEDVAELGDAAASPFSVLPSDGGKTDAGSGEAASVVGGVGIPIARRDGARGDDPAATSCRDAKVGWLSLGTRVIDVRRLDDGSTSCPLSRSIGGPNALFFGVFERGLKKMPAGCPGGLEISNPDEGVEPSCTALCWTASSEKYSVLFDMPKGDGGGCPARSNISFGPDLLERSELLRALGGRLPPAGERFDGWPV
jgi:hypothetical protein